MRPVSDAFTRSVRGSHRMVAEARVVEPGQIGADPDGVPLTILGGDVQMSGSANVRSTLDLSVDGTNMWPSSPRDLLAPYGNEIFVRRGIAYGNGTVEWVSLGYHRIDTPEQDSAPDGPIRITASDRMKGIIAAKMLAPRQFERTARYSAVVDALVREVYPWASIEWDDPATAAQQIGRQLICDDDRYKFLSDLVTAAGKVWAWDHRGVLVIKAPPTAGEPVFAVNHGEGGVLVKLSRRLSREGVFNGVVATGTATDDAPPVRAVAIDNDPDSPTYWHGNFGKVPRQFSSPLLDTQAKARTAAGTILRRSLGVPYTIDFSAVPNPALEPLDPVLVTYGVTGRLETVRSEVHVLDRLTVPLVATAPLKGATREQTDAEIDFL